MKILHITDASAAGVLAAITNLARAQAEHADVAAVRFCYTPRPESLSHEEIVSAMGPKVEVNRWSTRSRTAVPSLIRGLLMEMRRGEFDLVHLHSSRAGFLGRVIARALHSSAHIVYSPHGFAFDRSDFSVLAAAVFLNLERLALHDNRSLVLVSEGEAAVARTKLPLSQTAVLPNVVDTASFVRAKSGTEGNAAEGEDEVLRVLHIGRIMTQKRPEMFAAVAAQAHQVYPGRFEFVWIGDGDRALLHDGSDTSLIEVTGWVAPDELRTHLSRASLMLFTSSGEGMPISLLEASSMEVPTVGSDVVGVRDLVTDGVDGFLIGTVDEAVGALGRLLKRACRRNLGTAARDRVLAHHSHADLGDRSLRIYRKLGYPSTNSTLEITPESTTAVQHDIRAGERSS